MEEAYCANCLNKDTRWAKIYRNYVRNLLQPQYTAQDSVHKKRASMYFSLYSKDCFNVSLQFSYQNEGMNVCEILETRR